MRLILLSTKADAPGSPLWTLGHKLNHAGAEPFIISKGKPAVNVRALLRQYGVAGWWPLPNLPKPLAVVVSFVAARRWARVLVPDLLLASTPAAAVIANMVRGTTGGQALSVFLVGGEAYEVRSVASRVSLKALRESDRVIVDRQELREALLRQGGRGADTFTASTPQDVVRLCFQFEADKEFHLPLPPIAEVPRPATPLMSRGGGQMDGGA